MCSTTPPKVRLLRPGHRAPRKTLQPPHVFVVAVRKTVCRLNQLAFVKLVKPPAVRTAVHPHCVHTLFYFFSHPLHTSLSPPVLYEVINFPVVDAVLNPLAGARRLQWVPNQNNCCSFTVRVFCGMPSPSMFIGVSV